MRRKTSSSAIFAFLFQIPNTTREKPPAGSARLCSDCKTQTSPLCSSHTRETVCTERERLRDMALRANGLGCRFSFLGRGCPNAARSPSSFLVAVLRLYATQTLGWITGGSIVLRTTHKSSHYPLCAIDSSLSFTNQR
jgi:hypothetical protein